MMALPDDSFTIHIIEDDVLVQEAIKDLLRSHGIRSRTYASATDFYANEVQMERSIYLVDIRLGLHNGLDIVDFIIRRNPLEVVLVITSFGSFEIGAEAIKRGALDVLEKPFSNQSFMAKIQNLEVELDRRIQLQRGYQAYEGTLASLSPGEKKVFEYLLKGTANKVIAAELDISIRTVELRRAKLLKVFGVGSLAELVAMHCSYNRGDQAPTANHRLNEESLGLKVPLQRE